MPIIFRFSNQKCLLIKNESKMSDRKKNLNQKMNNSELTAVLFLIGLRGEFFVDDVDSESVSGALHLGDEVSQVLDGLHLLLQEGSLQEVGQLGVIVLAGSPVNLEKRLKKKKKIF